MPGDTKTDFSTLKWKTSLFKIAWIRSKRAKPKGQDPKGQNPIKTLTTKTKKVF